jgi:hypothetical protein
MAEQRPDPDALLRKIEWQEEKARCGRLKIFFGAAAGVGKTYAMLGEAGEKGPGSICSGILRLMPRRPPHPPNSYATDS